MDNTLLESTFHFSEDTVKFKVCEKFVKM